MHLRRTATAALALALLATACGAAGDDAADDPTTTVTDEATDTPTDDPTTAATSEPAAEATEEPAGEDTDGSADEDAAGGGIEPVTVALWFDDQRVPIESACNGVDGAVLATTVGEVTITIVREEGLAMRYQAEGLEAETSDVTEQETGVTSVYEATLESADVPAVDVRMETGDTSVLPDC